MKTLFQDLGTLPYTQALEYQELLFNKVVAQKLALPSGNSTDTAITDNYLLFVEHPNVYTLGKNGSAGNLLASLLQLQARKAEFITTNRGGDITYHGPGQIVGYPILNLDYFAKGVKDYIWKLEEAVIGCLQHYGLSAYRLDGATGVWLDPEIPGRARKICAIGVRIGRGVSMHGFAFNVNTELSYFDLINPCGFTDKKVTSLSRELGKTMDITEVKDVLKQSLAGIFGMELTEQEIPGMNPSSTKSV
jgi:lipoyl(octanoyl) transferase